ncbi:MAG: hypothetical protein ACT4PZ_11250 [Panacagrimonas sp.]
MRENPQQKSVPGSDFVARIDELLGKDSPDCTIPWKASPVPDWARDFHPLRIIDLGTGTGGFLHSVIVHLQEWGVLDELENILLIESDRDLLPGGPAVFRAHLTNQARASSFARNGRLPTIDVHIEPITLAVSRSGTSTTIPILEAYRDTDLTLSSHLTYVLLRRRIRTGAGAIPYGTYVTPAGWLWCIIRKRESPTYRARTLDELGALDAKPFDYSEIFESQVLPSLRDARMLAVADHNYLLDRSFPRRGEAARLLMW